MDNLEALKFTHELVIKEHHLDSFSHVYNATYLQILEQVRWDLITSRGYGLDKVHELGQGPTILDIQIRFKKELVNRQHITIETQCIEFKKKTSRLSQKIFNAQNELCAEAVFTFGLFDTKTRRLIEATPAWKHAMGIE